MDKTHTHTHTHTRTRTQTDKKTTKKKTNENFAVIKSGKKYINNVK